jgi:hypothetical protein
VTLADAQSGQSICDPYAGTGGLPRGSRPGSAGSRHRPPLDPLAAAGIDPVVFAGLAVNMRLRDLGPRVVNECADVLAEGDWQARAAAEQDAAVDRHRMRLLAARALTTDRLMTEAVQPAGADGRTRADGTPPSPAAPPRRLPPGAAKAPPATGNPRGPSGPAPPLSG